MGQLLTEREFVGALVAFQKIHRHRRGGGDPRIDIPRGGRHAVDQRQLDLRRLLLEGAGPAVGFGTLREWISVAAAVLAIVLAVCLLVASRPSAPRGSWRSAGPAVVALWVTACLALAYSLAAAYSLPWYDLLVWAAIPAVASPVVDRVALARLTTLAVAYVPGRVVGMSAEVEHLTLVVRREVAPWVVLGLWLVVIGAGARSVWTPRRGPRRARRPCRTPTSPDSCDARPAAR